MISASIVNPVDVDFDLEYLGKITERISQAAPLPKVIAEIVEFVATVVNCDSCMIYVLDGDALVLEGSKNPPTGVVLKLKIKPETGSDWLTNRLSPVAIGQGAYGDARCRCFTESCEERFEAFLSVPMISGGRFVGAINVHNRTAYAYDRREVGLLSLLGSLVGAEIEVARLRSEMTALAQRLEHCADIEKATRLLRTQLNLAHNDAYLLLQKESRRRRKSMKEIGDAIILGDDLKNASRSMC